MFDYRGVIVDVDPEFAGSDEWYEHVARTRPPRHQPWYHVLVDKSDHQTYVAQRNLRSEPEPRPIQHPLVAVYFSEYGDGVYVPRRKSN